MGGFPSPPCFVAPVLFEPCSVPFLLLGVKRLGRTRIGLLVEAFFTSADVFLLT